MLEFAMLVYMGLAVCAVMLYIYMFHPVLFIHFYFKVAVYISGMKLRYTEIDGMSICYGEKGKKKPGQTTMVLIHGFTACKFMWAPFAQKLSGDCHVIAVDLPGHGDSDTPSDDEDISHRKTVERMRKLCVELELDKDPFHLVGMSMGGALAGLYAAEHPEHVNSLSLICPAMATPKDSPVWEGIYRALDENAENIHNTCNFLFPKTPGEVLDMLNVVQYNNGWIPKKILQGVVDFRKGSYPFYSRLFKMITQRDNHDLLRDCAHKIQAPTQIVWGEHDKVIDLSGATLLQELVPNCVQVDIIPRCGHSMSTDRPGAMTKAIVSFRQRIAQSTATSPLVADIGTSNGTAGIQRDTPRNRSPQEH